MAEFTRCFHLSESISFKSISFYQMMSAAWCEYVDLSTFSRCTENMRLIFFSLFFYCYYMVVWIQMMKCNRWMMKCTTNEKCSTEIPNYPFTPRNRKQHACKMIQAIWIKNTLTHVRLFPFDKEKRREQKSARTQQTYIKQQQ